MNTHLGVSWKAGKMKNKIEERKGELEGIRYF